MAFFDLPDEERPGYRRPGSARRYELARHLDAAASWEQEPAAVLSEEAYRRLIGRKSSVVSGMDALQWLLSTPFTGTRRLKASWVPGCK